MRVAVRHLLVAFALVLLGSAMAVAQGPGMGPGGMGRGGFAQRRPPMERALGAGQWWNNPRMVTQLKLTDDQRKAMDGILLAHREQLVDLQATLEKAELELQPMMKADQVNETQTLAQIDKVAQARADLEKANGRFLLDIRAKLTPDQWKQLEDLRMNGMQRRQGDGRGPRPQRQFRRGPGGPGNPQGNPPPPPPDGTQAAPGPGGEL